jgi:Single-strand binding protein family
MSLNKVMVIGHLGQDPEIRYTPAGMPVVNLSVATDEAYIDKEGKRQERVESLRNDRLRFAAIVGYAACRTRNRSAELQAKGPADEDQTTIRRTGCTRG